MNRASGPLRVALIEILASRRGLVAVPDILAVAIDEDAAVRAAAMKALGQLASTGHLPGMVQGILKAEPGRERVAAEKCVMFVCSRIADADQRATPLLAAMKSLGSAPESKSGSTLS